MAKSTSRVARLFAAFFSGLLLVGFAACSAQGELGGSIAGTYDLSFDRVRAYWLAKDLVIIFESDHKTSSPAKTFGDPIANQPVRLTFDSVMQPLTTGTDLVFERNAAFALALAAERYVLIESSEGSLAQDPQFPEIMRGKANFEDLPNKPGRPLKGTFECTFIDDRFLWGTFDTEMGVP